MTDVPAYLNVGTAVSAKYRGAFCEARVKIAKRLVKCKVNFKDGSSAIVLDENIKGQLKVGQEVEARHPERGDWFGGVIQKLTDASTYTVVFDDGDEKTLRRTSLCLQGEKHFHESETLDQMPLTDPENFGTPVMKDMRGSRKKKGPESGRQDFDEDDEDTEPEIFKREEPENAVGKVVIVEMNDRRKSNTWFPALIVDPSCTKDIGERGKDHIVTRSFKDNKYYTVADTNWRTFASKDHTYRGEVGTLKNAIEKAVIYIETGQMPQNWDIDMLRSKERRGGSDSSDDSSDDEYDEEKDAWLASLYKFMEERGTPINNPPVLEYRDLNLHKLYKLVQDMGGCRKVTDKQQWRYISRKLGFPPINTTQSYNVKASYNKYLFAFEEHNRKLGPGFRNVFTRTRRRPSYERFSPISPNKSVKEEEKKKEAEKKEIVKKEMEKDIEEEEEDVQEQIKKEDEKKQEDVKMDPIIPTPVVKKKTRRKTLEEGKEIEPERMKEPMTTKEKDEEDKKEPFKIDDKKGKGLMKKVKKTEDQVTKNEFYTEPIYQVGEKVQVFYGKGRTGKIYEAKVVKIGRDEGEIIYNVHYAGWNNRYDEKVKAQRIVGSLEKGKDKRKKDKQKDKELKDKLKKEHDVKETEEVRDKKEKELKEKREREKEKERREKEAEKLQKEIEERERRERKEQEERERRERKEKEERERKLQKQLEEQERRDKKEREEREKREKKERELQEKKHKEMMERREKELKEKQERELKEKQEKELKEKKQREEKMRLEQKQVEIAETTKKTPSKRGRPPSASPKGVIKGSGSPKGVVRGSGSKAKSPAMQLARTRRSERNSLNDPAFPHGLLSKRRKNSMTDRKPKFEREEEESDNDDHDSPPQLECKPSLTASLSENSEEVEDESTGLSSNDESQGESKLQAVKESDERPDVLMAEPPLLKKEEGVYDQGREIDVMPHVSPEPRKGKKRNEKKEGKRRRSMEAIQKEESFQDSSSEATSQDNTDQVEMEEAEDERLKEAENVGEEEEEEGKKRKGKKRGRKSLEEKERGKQEKKDNVETPKRGRRRKRRKEEEEATGDKIQSPDQDILEEGEKEVVSSNEMPSTSSDKLLSMGTPPATPESSSGEPSSLNEEDCLPFSAKEESNSQDDQGSSYTSNKTDSNVPQTFNDQSEKKEPSPTKENKKGKGQKGKKRKHANSVSEGSAKKKVAKRRNSGRGRKRTSSMTSVGDASSSDSDDSSLAENKPTKSTQKKREKGSLNDSESNKKDAKPCKYNFLIDVSKITDPDERINLIQKQLIDLRKIYLELKSEVAAIDRKRKKFRRKEREAQAAAALMAAKSLATISEQPPMIQS